MAKAPLCDSGQNLLCRNIDLRYPRAYFDDGGELVVIGGPDRYGVGGCTGTALDDVLPVGMKLPQRVALALNIERLATQSNVNISKVAGEGVINPLTPADRVAVNDASGTDAPGGGWAVPMQYVVNKAAIDRTNNTMTPVDPVSDKPALTAAYKALQCTNARIKHIILLDDGDAEDSYSAHVTQIHKAGIAISAVAIEGRTYGFGADYGTMQNIACWGVGC